MTPISKITDIVVPLNEFLITADTVSGGLYICKNGGMGLLTKSTLKDDRYIMKKFFGYIESVPSKVKYDHEYYYDDMKLPPVVIDHLLDNDTDENILSKVKQEINKKAKWMDRKGILAIAEMTFNHDISTKYRKINPENIKLLQELSEKFNVHILGNCSQIGLDKILDIHSNTFNSINGNIVCSAEMGSIKCSKSGRYDIYDNFLSKCGIDIERTVFVETHIGHIKALENFGKYKEVNIKSILYNQTNQTMFLSDLSKLLHINIDTDPKESDVNSTPLANSEETIINANRIGNTIADSFTKGPILYEQLIDKDGNIKCVKMDIDISTMKYISYDEYKKVHFN
jgi:FMN phosphatase YigB (HAD superfamily)